MSIPIRPAVRVLLIDDSTLVREGIRRVIATHGRGTGIKMVGEAASGASGLAEVARVQPDVVLLDIRLPDGSGLAACREILRQHPKICVLILTSFVDDSLVYDSVVAGARGYLMKEIEPSALIEAVLAGAEGRAVLSSDITSRVFRIMRGDSPQAEHPGVAALSGQEHRVLALLAEGLTNKEVGGRLGLSENTVKNYLISAFEKLKVKRRSQAALVYTQAMQRGKQA